METLSKMKNKTQKAKSPTKLPDAPDEQEMKL